MKKQLTLAAIVLASSLFNFVAAQCLKPTPMTPQQIQRVTGKWIGTYTNNDKQQEIVVNIYVNQGNEVTCDIDNPPLPGKETDVEYFFCPGGEFHLRKYIGDVSYVFQGTPENNRIKGIVSVYDGKNQRKKTGDFLMSKVE